MKLWREEIGQDLVEYVLLVSMIALAVALAFPPVATAMVAAFNRVVAAVGGGGGGGAP